MSEPLVIIGNGMATMRLVEELSLRALGRYAIAVIGEEPRLAYNRVLLSSVLAREVSRSDIELKPAHWWRAHGVTLMYGQRAVAIDADIRRVKLANGATLPFAKLVLATGSQPIRLNVPGMDLPGVMTFRDLADVASIESAAETRRKAVVIGGGLLGLEAAYGLAKAGLQVSVVHLMDRLMERQLDARASAMLKSAVEAKGIAVHLNAETVGHQRSSSRRGGRAQGRPRDRRRSRRGRAPASAPMPILRHRGYRDQSRHRRRRSHADPARPASTPSANAPSIAAFVTGWWSRPMSRRACWPRIFSGGDARYDGSVLATNLKVSGVNVFSAGDFLGAPGTEQIVLTDAGLGSYKKLVIADGKLIGAVLFGDTADGLWYLDLIRSGASIAAIRDDLVFGRALTERAHPKELAA